ETRWVDYFPRYYSTVTLDNNYNIFYPNLAFVFDNIRWGSIGPHSGRRVRLRGHVTLFSDFDTKTCVLDYRRYFALSPRASFAARLVLAGSWGRDPDQWSIGGSYTLRGYDSYEFSGSELGFLNLEYRFPFIDRLRISFPLPIEFRNIRGVLFSDFGGVYSDSFKVYESDGGFHLEDLKMGIGAGLRVNFLYMIWQFNVARTYNFQEFTDDWKYYLVIGPEW
ncbi:BamA/TamA family outer membrane protein, partial [candidate division WOR-3 bacterium]|nr:BamA/TamA family outer membrane protein [candidate division WOR-3 bacterium]